MGVDKVGVGTDWGAVYPKPLELRLNREMERLGFRKEHRVDWGATLEGYKSWKGWSNITRDLVSRGYSDDEIQGILGGNFLRIFKQIVGE